MRITLAAIGRLKDSPERDLLESYRKRLTWKLEIKEFESKKNLPTETKKHTEAEWLKDALHKTDYIIALDERGKSFTSLSFANHLKQLQNRSIGHIGVAIGGSDGLDTAFTQSCNLVLNFGTLTWPHMLVRTMLTEQLYRAQSILAGHPYHRE
jgi:23S rRNA (pseudouridine1915-N3)-methyltransferase